MHGIHTVGVLLSALLITGCASTPKQQFNKAANADVKNIVVLEAGPIEQYEVSNLGHAGMSFGLIGGLIAAADISSKSSEFTQLVRQRNFKGEEEYRTALVESLARAGYKVTLAQVKRKEGELLKSYSGLPGEGEAYLDSRIQSGFYSASGASDYVPMFRAHVRLVRKGSGDVIFEDQIAYGYENRRESAVNIAADPKYQFKDFVAIQANPDLALEGMRVGIPAVADRVAQALAQ